MGCRDEIMHNKRSVVCWLSQRFWLTVSACWIVYLCPCNIACLPAVWQEFLREPVKRQEARRSWGNGLKLVLLSAAIKLFFLMFPAPVSAFSTSPCSKLLCSTWLTLATGCWGSCELFTGQLCYEPWPPLFSFHGYCTSVLHSDICIGRHSSER